LPGCHFVKHLLQTAGQTRLFTGTLTAFLLPFYASYISHLASDISQSPLAIPSFMVKGSARP
jgi:hypothetical protein